MIRAGDWRHKGGARAHASPDSTNEVVNGIEPDETDQDQVEGNNIIQQPRYEQDQDAGNERNKRLNMGEGECHDPLLLWWNQPSMARGSDASGRGSSAQFPAIMSIRFLV